MPCPSIGSRVTRIPPAGPCAGRCRSRSRSGAGSRPLGSPALYGTGGGFMLGLRRHRHLTQGGIVPCCSTWHHYGRATCHCRQKRLPERGRVEPSSRPRGRSCRSRQRTLQKLVWPAKAAQAVVRDRLRTPVKLTACAGVADQAAGRDRLSSARSGIPTDRCQRRLQVAVIRDLHSK